MKITRRQLRRLILKESRILNEGDKTSIDAALESLRSMCSRECSVYYDQNFQAPSNEELSDAFKGDAKYASEMGRGRIFSNMVLADIDARSLSDIDRSLNAVNSKNGTNLAYVYFGGVYGGGSYYIFDADTANRYTL